MRLAARFLVQDSEARAGQMRKNES
jgi:hypothetical protein